MGKVLSIIVGLAILALGIWGLSAWSAQVLVFLQAAIAITAVLVGLGILVFGVSELRSSGEPPVLQSPAQPPLSDNP